MSIELDDLFGALEDEVDALDAETPLDRHDRTRAARLAASTAHQAANVKAADLFDSHSIVWAADGVPMYASEARRAVREWHAAGTLRFTDSADASATAAYVGALDAEAAAAAAYADANAEYTAALAALDLENGFPEGVYVSFQTRNGRNNEQGFGVIESVSATAYKIRIDRRNIRPYYESQTFAKVSIKGAMNSRNGGRELRLLWGPTGDAARKTAQDERDAAKRIQDVRMQAAFAAKRIDEAAYEAALVASSTHRTARFNIESNAREAAIVMLTAAYAKQFDALIRAATLALESELAGYEDPEILSSPDPRRRNVREWLPKEDT